MIERSIAATTHGRYLVVPPNAPRGAPMLVGFHGYAEGAEAQLDRLRLIPESDQWLLVSIQGLHRFYQRRTNEVIASWMTRQDREQMIRDNVAYVSDVIGAAAQEWECTTIVLAGFSQGVAMAFRAVAHDARIKPVPSELALRQAQGERVEGSSRSMVRSGTESFEREGFSRAIVAGVIAVGGDVPPELDSSALARVGSALICRGLRDEWYTAAKFQDDLRRLRDAGVSARAVEFDGGHEWSDAVIQAASRFLSEHRR